MLSDTEALDIVRKVCGQRGLPFLEPVEVRRTPRRIRVRTHAGRKVANVRVKLDAATGEVLRVSFTSWPGTAITMGEGRNGELVLGESTRVHGPYLVHWEWTRFVHVVPQPIYRDELNYCSLEPAHGVPDVFEAAGIAPPTPKRWRRHPRSTTFDVTADVVPIEQGRFDWGGNTTWRLRVERWVEVKVVWPFTPRGG